MDESQRYWYIRALRDTGLTFEEVGRYMDLSRERVRQILVAGPPPPPCCSSCGSNSRQFPGPMPWRGKALWWTGDYGLPEDQRHYAAERETRVPYYGV